MANRILLLAWKGSAASNWVPELEAGGFQVFLEESTGKRAWRTAKERGIRVVIIDGSRKASLGMQTGHALRDTAKTRDIPILWTNAAPDGVDEIKKILKPDRLLLSPTSAQQALNATQELLQARAPASPSNSTDPVKASEKRALPPPSRTNPTLPAADSIINPVNYANVFAPPEAKNSTLYPATIVVDDSRSTRPQRQAWQPVEGSDEGEE